MRGRAAAAINAAALGAVILVNFLANVLPLGGRTTGEVAAQYETLFTPASFAFSIWWLIYVLLTGFCLYGFFRPQLARAVCGPFSVAAFFNITWVLLWHHGHIPLTLVATLGLLACLVRIYLRIPREPRRVLPIYLAVEVPFSIYLAWVSVIAVSNAVVVARHYGVPPPGMGEMGWLVTMMALAAGLSVWVALGGGLAASAAAVRAATGLRWGERAAMSQTGHKRGQGPIAL